MKTPSSKDQKLLDIHRLAALYSFIIPWQMKQILGLDVMPSFEPAFIAI